MLLCSYCMAATIYYTIVNDAGEHKITITPVSQFIPGSNLCATGIFKLTENGNSIGDIIFDDNMKQWEYTGLGDLTHQDAAEIAGFIQIKNASGANNNKAV